MIYKGNFTGKDGSMYQVQLITESGTGTTEIKLGAEPVVIEYSGTSDIFKPLKLSSATIRCWVDSYMFDLFTGKAQGTKCIIYKGDQMYWQGYVTPNIYNQDYLKNKFELEIECVDGLSTLDYVKYSTETKTIRSFDSIIKEAVSKTGLAFNSFNIASLPKNLSDMYISDQNWYDEDGEAMTYKEILENILQYLNLTMFQSGNVIYIVDYNNMSTANRIDLSNKIIYDDATISLSEVYNQITIKSSLYNSSDFVYNISDDKLTYETGNIFSGQVDTTKFKGRKVLNNKIKLNPELPSFDALTFQSTTGAIGFLRGSAWHKDDAEKGRNEWNTLLSYRNGGVGHTNTRLIASIGNTTLGAFQGGYFALKGNWYIQDYDSPFPRDNAKTRGGTESSCYLRVCFKVGDWYATGSLNSDKTKFNVTWSKTKGFINIPMKDEKSDMMCVNTWLSNMELTGYVDEVSNLSGFIIPAPSFCITGKIQLEIYEFYTNSEMWFFYKDVSVDYAKPFDKSLEGIVSIAEYSDTDTVWQVAINNEYSSEFSDIELKVATDNNKGLSFSSVLCKDASSNYQFLSSVNKGDGNYPYEQYLLDAYYKQYSVPCKTIELSLKSPVSMFNTFIDSNFSTSNFILNSLKIDVANNISNIQIIEKQ